MMRLLRAAKRARRMGKAQQTVPQKMAARLLRQDMAQEQKHRRHPQKRRVRRQPLRQTRPETMTWLTAQIQKTKTQNSQIEKKEDNTMETMNVKDFYFDLPQELIAQDPLEDRSSSRLLVLDKNTGETEHRHFRDITEYLRPGDCLVINNTKVIPARLFGVKEDTQAKIEVLLLKRRENDIWETLVKPGKKCKPGTVIVFGEGLLKGTVIDVVDEGNRLIQFSYEGIFEEIPDQLGQMPLPPYITHQLKDKNRYQTVYAEHDGSSAAGHWM